MMDRLSDNREFDVIGSRHYFAGAHLRAAQLMAANCRERELAALKAALEEGPDGLPTIDYDVRSYAVCAIVEAAAFVEARVNELWHAAIEATPEVTGGGLAGLPESQIAAIRALAEEDRADRQPVLDKLDETLFRVTGSRIEKGTRPWEDVAALMKLRDAFVHFKPEQQWDNEAHALEKRLRSLVPANPLLQGAKPWFPHHVLSAGVAQWACEKSAELISQWEHELGLTASYEDIALIITEAD
jgi:hypothetical protein